MVRYLFTIVAKRTEVVHDIEPVEVYLAVKKKNVEDRTSLLGWLTLGWRGGVQRECMISVHARLVETCHYKNYKSDKFKPDMPLDVGSRAYHQLHSPTRTERKNSSELSIATLSINMP